MTTTDDPSRERPSFEPGREAPVPIREWLTALVFVGGVIVAVTALIIWFAFTFIFHPCGAVPCG